MKKVDNKKIIFWILIIIGIVVRTYHYPSALSEMNCDEIMTAVNAKAIADTGKDCRRNKFTYLFARLGRTERNAIISHGSNYKNIWIQLICH